MSPHLDIGNIIYSPPRLEPSLSAVLKFPGPPTELSSVTALFNDVVAVFEQRKFSAEVSYWGALFSMASWLPELFLNPPTLIACGPDLQPAATFFALLNCMCRRSFFTPQLCHSLPFEVQPTLLILAAEMSAKVSAFWRAANVRGVLVPSGGGVKNFACARALFVQDNEAFTYYGPEVWRLPLPANTQYSPLNEQELSGISNEVLPKMLAFRL